MIELAPRTARELSGFSRKVQRQLIKKIDSLAEDPRPKDAEKLKGAQGLYRVRSGDYRIIYQIKDKTLAVFEVCLARRKDVQERLPGQ